MFAMEPKGLDKEGGMSTPLQIWMWSNLTQHQTYSCKIMLFKLGSNFL